MHRGEKGWRDGREERRPLRADGRVKYRGREQRWQSEALMGRDFRAPGEAVTYEPEGGREAGAG